MVHNNPFSLLNSFWSQLKHFLICWSNSLSFKTVRSITENIIFQMPTLKPNGIKRILGIKHLPRPYIHLRKSLTRIISTRIQSRKTTVLQLHPFSPRINWNWPNMVTKGCWVWYWLMWDGVIGGITRSSDYQTRLWNGKWHIHLSGKSVVSPVTATLSVNRLEMRVNQIY